jgi:UDP-N-acetylglucosamine 1-carboxyvinyltransferase
MLMLERGASDKRPRREAEALPPGSALVVRGGRPLAGTVRPEGFKHALVTTVAASCAADAPIVIRNCPRLVETTALREAILDLGGSARHEGSTLTIDARPMTRAAVRTRSAGEVHGSIYLAAGLLGRFGEATVPTGGGCRIGDNTRGHRPVEHYVNVFERFGARADYDQDGYLRVRASRLTGTEIDLLDYTSDRELQTGPLYSGATKMAMLTAAVAHGTTVLHNPYPKPDVTELFAVLRSFGADIEETPTHSYVIRGRGPGTLVRPVVHQLPPDLIEVVTWICVGTLFGRGALRIEGAQMDRAWDALRPERDVLARMGVPVALDAGAVVVHPAATLHGVDMVVTSRGVFSDNQPFFSLLASYAKGTSTFRETVWSNRFDYLEGLRTLGVSLGREGATASIRGPRPPHKSGQTIHAHDLRSAAVLVLAALGITGPTVITGTHHLARGYSDLPAALCRLGADVRPAGSQSASIPASDNEIVDGRRASVT